MQRKVIHPPAAAYGFFETAEGRNFLRFCYDRFLDEMAGDGVAAASHGRVAAQVADEFPEDQPGENRKTAQALRRWLEDGKSEIWQANGSKNLRILERLERLMASEESVGMIMADRAASIRKLEFAKAIANFFMPHQIPYDLDIVRQSLAQYEGVFSFSARLYGHDRYELYYYLSDTHFRAELHHSLPILSIQEFDLIERDGRKTALNRRSGFIFVNDQGRVFRFLINQNEPIIRWIEIFTPVKVPTDITHISKSDRRYYASTIGVDALGMEGAAVQRKTMISGFGDQDNSDILVNVANRRVREFAEAEISGIQWEIPL